MTVIFLTRPNPDTVKVVFSEPTGVVFNEIWVTSGEINEFLK